MVDCVHSSVIEMALLQIASVQGANRKKNQFARSMLVIQENKFTAGSISKFVTFKSCPPLKGVPNELSCDHCLQLKRSSAWRIADEGS